MKQEIIKISPTNVGDCKQALKEKTAEIFKKFDELLDDDGMERFTPKWHDEYIRFRYKMGVE